MIAMISTDEYRELIMAKEESDNCRYECKLAMEKLKETEQNLKELLLVITKGEVRTKFDEGKFQSYDVASNYEMADFINENYVEDGILKFKKVKKENKDEQGN